MQSIAVVAAVITVAYGIVEDRPYVRGSLLQRQRCALRKNRGEDRYREDMAKSLKRPWFIAIQFFWTFLTFYFGLDSKVQRENQFAKTHHDLSSTLFSTTSPLQSSLFCATSTRPAIVACPILCTASSLLLPCYSLFYDSATIMVTSKSQPPLVFN